MHLVSPYFVQISLLDGMTARDEKCDEVIEDDPSTKEDEKIQKHF